MNQHKKRILCGGFLLMVCALLMVGCIHPEEGDFPTTLTDETTSPQVVDHTTPQETIPEDTTPVVTPPEQTTPEDTTPEQTTPEQTTPEDTTPEQTTPEETTPEQTTPPVTTPPEITTDPPITPPTPTKKIKIYIDQGHNPFSPTHPPSWNTGASNEALGLYEQDLTYEIGILLAELLSKDERFEVRLSRPTPETILGTDNDSALDFRTSDATEWGADYFISLHTNSSDAPSASGLEVYAFNTENEGYALGGTILKELQASTGLRNRGMKTADYRVLKNATMPAALVEMGFISNWDDANLLDNSPELFAQGLYNGILSYFNSLEKETTTE